MSASLRPGKESVPSRAYIVFKSAEQVATFSREYDGHLFRDKQGQPSNGLEVMQSSDIELQETKALQS